MIVVKSGAGCDAAGPPRKKKLLSRIVLSAAMFGMCASFASN